MTQCVDVWRACVLTPPLSHFAGWLASGALALRLAPAAAARCFSAAPAEVVVKEAASANELGAICRARARTALRLLF